jgi:hypothetical protein
MGDGGATYPTVMLAVQKQKAQKPKALKFIYTDQCLADGRT